MENREYFLRTLYQATNIPFYICSVEMDNSIDFACPDINVPGFTGYIASLVRETVGETEKPVIITLPNMIYTGFIHLNENVNIILGPAASLDRNEGQLDAFLGNLPIGDDARALKELLLFNPRISLENMINTMILAVRINSGVQVNREDFIIKNLMEAYPGTAEKAAGEILNVRENRSYHTPRDYESRLMSYVEAGDFEGLVRFSQAPIPGKEGVLSYDADRNARYNYIVTVTIACRAAIRGGADAEAAYSLSDTLLKEMDRSPAPFNGETLLYSALQSFCALAAGKGTAPESKLVTQCRDFVSRNLHVPITLEMLSAECGVTPRWLSHKYRQETGESIVDHIHREKMKEACRLLKYTRLTVVETSAILGYSSQSYFGAVFKKYIGTTPKEYALK